MKSNQEIAQVLNKIADMHEMNLDNPYRVRAYRRAARSLEKLNEPVSELIAAKVDLTTLPYVGKHIAEHIKNIAETGEVPGYLLQEKESKQFRNELKQITGLGPKRINLLKEKYGIGSIDALKAAINTGQLRKIRGFNEELEKRILHSIENPKPYVKHITLRLSKLIVEALRERLLTIPTVTRVECAGDFRRKTELTGNLIFIVATNQPELVIEQFTRFNEVKELVKIEKQIAIVILKSGMQATLELVAEDEFASTLLFATGSEDHLTHLQKIAQKKKIHLKSRASFKSEADIYEKLALNYVEPELREALPFTGKTTLPKLITLSDIKGDLHTHTNETDGTEDLITMVAAAEKRGYQYIAITDHSKHLAFVNGLDEKRLLKQIKLIDELNSRLKNIRILKSSEVDILADGSLDFSNDILKELDVRVCSVHSLFKLPVEKQTERIIRAMDNPYFNILGHATGRLLNRRSPYPLDIERILLAAFERGCIIELNASPSRLDIKDTYCQMAKEIGVKIAISSDAHSLREFDNMQYGVYQARRGWLEANDVVNTRTLKELLKLFKR